MKLVLAGGSGQVGQMLARAFVHRGDEVVIVSRTPSEASAFRTVAWDGESMGEWTTELEGADAVINLAGRSVNCRYTEKNRRAILDSRVNSTRIIGQALRRATNPPPVWLQASTATIYAHRFDAANDEATGIIGGSEAGAPETWNFSIAVATAWERALAESMPLPRTRAILMRSP